MTHRAWPLALPLVLVAFIPAFAEETIKLKFKKSSTGERSLHESVESEDSTTQIIGPDGTVIQDKKEKKVTRRKYTDTILEQAKAKRPTKLRRVYEKFEVEVGDTVTPSPLQGKTVVIEKKKDKYQFFTADGQELGAKDAESLAKEFNGDKPDDPDVFRKIMVPEDTVTLNKRWKLDVKAFSERFGSLPVDVDKAQATGKLVKVHKKDGHTFGVFEYRFELPLKGEFGPPGKGFPLPPGSKFSGEAILDGCIDGAVNSGGFEATFNIDIVGTTKVKDAELKIKIIGRLRAKNSDFELPPEKK